MEQGWGQEGLILKADIYPVKAITLISTDKEVKSPKESETLRTKIL